MPEPPKKEEQPNNNTSKATGQTRGRKKSVDEKLVKRSLGKDTANQSEDKQPQTNKDTKQEKSSEPATKPDLLQGQTTKTIEAKEESFEMDDLSFNAETFLCQINTFIEHLHKLDNSLSDDEKRKKFIDMKLKLFPLVIKNFFFFAYTKFLLDLPSEQELKQVNDDQLKRINANVFSTAIEYTLESVTNLVFALEEIIFEKWGIRGVMHSLDVKTEVSHKAPFFKLSKLSRPKPLESLEESFDLDRFSERIKQYRNKQNAHKIFYTPSEQENAPDVKQNNFLVFTDKALSLEDISCGDEQSTQPQSPPIEDTTSKLKQEMLSQYEEQEKSTKPTTNKPSLPQELGNLLKMNDLGILKVVIPDNKTTMKGVETGKVVAQAETAETTEHKVEALFNSFSKEELNKAFLLLRNKFGLALSEGEPAYKKNPLYKRVEEYAAFEWPKNILALKIVWEKFKKSKNPEEKFIIQQAMRNVLNIKHITNISFSNVKSSTYVKYLYAKWYKEDGMSTGKPICPVSLDNKLLIDSGLSEELKEIMATI